MVARSQTLVVIPNRRKLWEFLDAVKTTYGPSLTLPDIYGFRGIQTISGPADGIPEYASQTPMKPASQVVRPSAPTTRRQLILWSMTRSSNVCLYNLTTQQAIVACRELTGRTPCPTPELNREEILQSYVQGGSN